MVPEAPVWEQGLQVFITPLSIYALKVLALKIMGGGFHSQNNGKLKFDHETSNMISLGIFTSRLKLSFSFKVII